MIHFTRGIEYNGFSYGWSKKALYRLPSQSGRNNYGLKKLKKIRVGNTEGYRLKKDRFSMKRLQDLTAIIDIKVYPVSNKDTPF